jgi:hypothetical protein
MLDDRSAIMRISAIRFRSSSLITAPPWFRVKHSSGARGPIANE